MPLGTSGERPLAALELLYGCGLRVSELVGLRDGDVRIFQSEIAANLDDAGIERTDAVFVPTAFLGGISGQFFQQFAITIAVATATDAPSLPRPV